MKAKKKEIKIKSLIKDFSIETTPNIYAKYGHFAELLSQNNNIYITYLPNENPKRVVDTAKKLNKEKFKVIPHLPARTFIDNSKLEKYIAALSEIAGCEKILIIGGSGNQNGNISSSLDVLQTDLLSKYNFKEVGIAGHPEGNPDVTDEELDKAIVEKNQFANNVDYKMYLATQFFFEASSLIKWEKHLETLDNHLEIHAGIPGPATLKTLVYYATSCGIRNSISFLSKQAFNITKLATTRTPDKLIADLADYKNNKPSSKLSKLHFFPFGGINKTSKWLSLISSNSLDISSNNEFKPIID